MEKENIINLIKENSFKQKGSLIERWINYCCNNGKANEMEAAAVAIKNIAKGENFQTVGRDLQNLENQEKIDLAIDVVANFSKKGPQFYRATRVVGKNCEPALRQLENENVYLEQLEKEPKNLKIKDQQAKNFLKLSAFEKSPAAEVELVLVGFRNFEPTLSPYRQSAMKSLINYEKLEPKEAEYLATTLSYEELEARVGPESSVVSAATALAKEIGLTKEETKRFVDACLAKDHVYISSEDAKIFSLVAAKIDNRRFGNNSIISALASVHDKWVEDHADAFNKPNRAERKFQHLPLELIGFGEVKKDLVYFAPILRVCGKNVSEKALESAYDAIVYSYLSKNKLLTNSKLDEGKVAKHIIKLADTYKSLSDANKAKSEAEAEIMAGQVAKATKVKLKQFE